MTEKRRYNAWLCPNSASRSEVEADVCVASMTSTPFSLFFTKFPRLCKMIGSDTEQASDVFDQCVDDPLVIQHSYGKLPCVCYFSIQHGDFP